MKRLLSFGIIGLFAFTLWGCLKKESTTTPNVQLKARFKYANDFLTVTFTNSTIIPIGGDQPTYEWDFGDGNSSTQIAPSHTYDKEGTYVVTLTAKEDNNTSKVSDTLKVSKIPNSVTAEFKYEVNDLTVTFTNQTDFQGVEPTYKWDFGDGETSTVSDTMHTYTNYGTYVVKLITTQPDQSDTLTDTLALTAPPAPSGLITIDGDYADWDNMNIEAQNSDGSALKLLKGYMKDGVLYAYVESDQDLSGSVFHLFFNTDEDGSTGFNNYGNYPKGTGGDYLYEGDFYNSATLFEFTKGADQGNWAWNQASVMGDADFPLAVSDMNQITNGDYAFEFSIDLSAYLTGDSVSFAVQLLDGSYNSVSTLPESGQANSKYLGVKEGNTGGGGAANISIDGDLSDWSNINAAATNDNGTLTLLKTYGQNGILYLYVEGTDDLDFTHLYHVFINGDNDDQSGLSYWQYPAGSGADVVFEGSLLQDDYDVGIISFDNNVDDWGKNTGENYDFDNGLTDIGMTVSDLIDLGNGKKALELSWDLSKLNITSKKVSIGFMELDPNSYDSVGSLPAATTDDVTHDDAAFAEVDIKN